MRPSFLLGSARARDTHHLAAASSLLEPVSAAAVAQPENAGLGVRRVMHGMVRRHRLAAVPENKQAA